MTTLNSNLSLNRYEIRLDESANNAGVYHITSKVIIAESDKEAIYDADSYVSVNSWPFGIRLYCGNRIVKDYTKEAIENANKPAWYDRLMDNSQAFAYIQEIIERGGEMQQLEGWSTYRYEEARDIYEDFQEETRNMSKEEKINLFMMTRA